MINDFQISGIVKLSRTGNASFSALRANRNDYGGLLNPVIGFDDFRLSTDVFGPHQHRHMSALSYLFDDSAPYHNQDSMGSNLTITTGSLLWTWAGSGVTHHEFPETANENIHGLQLFLATPTATRDLPPKSVYIPVEAMPVRETTGVRIKVVMGTWEDLVNTVETPEAISFLDVTMEAGEQFQHTLTPGWNGLIYLMSGMLDASTPAGTLRLQSNDTIAFVSVNKAPVTLRASSACHFLFISGMPVT